jgi:glyoxylase-like metal-dependent hydrolase (beta-lactamase superfamily II)
MQEVLPGIYQWSWFSQEKGYDFNGHLVVSGHPPPHPPQAEDQAERVIIDPPPISPEDQEWLMKQGPITCIILTNRDHVREAQAFHTQLSTKIYIHEKDAPLIEIRADKTYRDGERLPGGLVAVHVPNNKSPGETALFLDRGKGVLFLGDALIGKPPGQLNLMPADKYADVAKAREGIGSLLKYHYDTVLVGDGVSILTGGRQAVEQFLKRR